MNIQIIVIIHISYTTDRYQHIVNCMLNAKYNNNNNNNNIK